MQTSTRHHKRNSTHRLLTASALVAVLLSLALPGIAAAAPNPPAAPYIIVFKDTVEPAAAASDLAKAYGLQPGFLYEHALKGMSAAVPAGRLVALQHDPRVAYVVEDMERHISAQTVPTGIQRIFADSNANLYIDGADDYRVDVDVAVIDTGIDLQHPDLNVVPGVNCTGKIFNAVCVAGGDDDHYHGTHVAGTIGALDNSIGVVGVAPGARLWPVKVLNKNGSGWSSWIIAGIDWVAAHAGDIEVANMSLGGSGFSQAEYDAIQGAVSKGVAFAVAAGNEDDDARNYSPGGFNNVLSVSALADFDGLPGGSGSPTCRTDQDDTLADFSNWGPEVDITAPGVCILSTYPLERGEYGTISGTSMASPHVAGALALLASASNPDNATDVYDLYGQVIGAGNYDWDDDSGDPTQEPLLDVSDTELFNPELDLGPGGPTNQPPSASFTYSASDLTVAFTDASTDSDGTIVQWSWDFGDDTTSTAQNPSHTYAAAGTYTVSLTVTDDDQATDTTSQDISVTSSVPNQPPSASFAFSASDLTVTFTDASTDSDGTIVQWSWNFGDGTTSAAQNPSHTYATAGTYTVRLTVTDDDQATGTTTQDVTVSSSSTGISLSVQTYKVRAQKYADLTWSGATSDNVDLYRDGSKFETTSNDGAYSDGPLGKTIKSATYQVCEAGTSTCSEEVLATW